MITIATQCDDRKAMVRRLSERLQTPAVYLYTPTYAFQIGEITVNRDASVSGEREALLPAAECLLENGYITELPAELTAADSEATAEEAPAEAESADTAAEDITVTTLRIYDDCRWCSPWCLPPALCACIRKLGSRDRPRCSPGRFRPVPQAIRGPTFGSGGTIQLPVAESKVMPAIRRSVCVVQFSSTSSIPEYSSALSGSANIRKASQASGRLVNSSSEPGTPTPCSR